MTVRFEDIDPFCPSGDTVFNISVNFKKKTDILSTFLSISSGGTEYCEITAYLNHDSKKAYGVSNIMTNQIERSNSFFGITSPILIDTFDTPRTSNSPPYTISVYEADVNMRIFMQSRLNRDRNNIALKFNRTFTFYLRESLCSTALI